MRTGDWFSFHTSLPAVEPEIRMSYLHRLAYYLALLIPAASCIVCKEAPPQAYIPSIVAAVADVGVTEAVFKVHLINPGVAPEVVLKRNDRVVASEILSASDTTLVDTSLSPNQTYLYRVFRLREGSVVDSSSPLTITSMDTTSHEFTWEIDTLGDGASSALYDVAIINDTLVFAVGAIYLRDSTGQFGPMYNVIRWNGREWLKFRVTVKLNYGTSVVITDQDPLVSAFAPALNDVWFVSRAGGVTRYLNGQWVMMDIPYPQGPAGTNKMWGTASNDMYFVAGGGRITHYLNGTWQKIESGTTLDIQDIWGARTQSGEWEILAVAGNYYVSNERKILRIEGTTVTALSDSGIDWALNGLWFSPERHYWVVGDGIWQKHLTLQSAHWDGEPNIITTYVTNRIRGNDINDVFFCGAYGDCFHFNGVGWKSYRSRTALSAGQYLSVAVKHNSVFLVGYQSPRAIVARGVRAYAVTSSEGGEDRQR